MRRQLTLLFLGALTLHAAGARAATAPPLEDVLVTGSYSPRPQLISSVSVLDRQRIEALNQRTLAGLLKQLPGVLVEEQGGPGGLTAVSIRGGEANFTLVLVDGVAVNDPTNFRGGSFDFGNLNSALIERIEVVRGAQSAIYGSDALAGVINIITRRPGDGHVQSAFVEAGEQEYGNAGVAALGTAGTIRYALEAATRDDGDAVPGSRRNTDSANLQLGWQPTAGQELVATWRYLDGDRRSYPEQSGGPAYALADDLDHSDYDQQVFALAWNGQLNESWQSTLRGSRFRHSEDYRSPGIPPFLEVPPNAADTDFTRDELLWVNTRQFGDDSLAGILNLGADYRREEGDSDGYVEFFGSRSPTDFELDRDTTGVFTALSAVPLDGVTWQGSVRFDDPEGFDSETSWRSGLRVDAGAGVSLYANWGEAFKLPSFFALGHGLVGNPDLQPEQAESVDAGVIWAPRETLRLEATWFDNDFRDLVDFDEETFRNVNRSNVQTSGVELQARWQVLPALQLATQGTYTDIDVKGEDTVLTGRPEWSASTVALWQLAPAWQSAFTWQYTGQQWAVSRYTMMEVREELDDYHRLDWTLQWQPAGPWQFQLAADNLLSENYETSVGFFAPGRSLRLGVRYTHETE